MPHTAEVIREDKVYGGSIHMCGRITTTFEFSDIRVGWNRDRDLPLYRPRYNLAPEQVR
jgi:hypothetical protein